MASNAINPTIVAWPGKTGGKLQQIRCAGSNTWNAGEFGNFESGLGDPCVTDEIPAFIYAEDQTTATSANDLVWVYLLETGMYLKMFLTNAGTDAAPAAADIGADYDLYVASNVHYANKGASSDDVFRVRGINIDLEPERETSGSTPGWVLVELMKVGVSQ